MSLSTIPLQCPNAESCRHHCSAKAQYSAKKVELLFILDKPNSQSTVFIDKVMQRFRETTYAVSYTHRYVEGKKVDDCMAALDADVRRLKPEVIVFMGDRGLNALLDNDRATEQQNRGTFYTVKFGDREISGILTYHASYFNVSPNAASLVVDDIQRAIHPELRKLRLQDQKSWNLLMKFSEVKDFINHMRYETEEKTCANDVETKNLNKKYGNKIATMQFSLDGVNSYIIPWQHKETPWDVHEQKKIRQGIRALYQDPNSKVQAWIFHRAQFDLHQYYAHFGVIPVQVVLDTIPGMWLLNENLLNYQGFSLDSISSMFGGDKYGGDPEVEKARKAGLLFDLPLKQLAPYGGRDTCFTKQLYNFQKKIAAATGYDKKWMKAMRYFYSPTLKMFTVMEDNGAPVDIAQIRYLKTPDSPLIKRMGEIDREVKSLPTVKETNKMLLEGSIATKMPTLFGAAKGGPSIFDINKKEHQRTLFFDVLGLEPENYGKPERTTGKKDCFHQMEINRKELRSYCTRCGAVAFGALDKEFQEAHKEVKEVALFTEYSGLKKLVTSYVDSLYRFVDPEKGSPDCTPDVRLRPNQNPTGTVTGRTSTTEPNLAQIPRARGGAKTAIKNLFNATPGRVIVQIDGKTMEVRGLGLVAKDRKLASIYNGAAKMKVEFLKNPTKEIKEKYELQEDIHNFNGAAAFGKDASKKIDKELRDAAKGVTFGLIYGMGAGTLAGNLNMSKKETQVIIDKVMGNMPDAKKWIGTVHHTTQKNLYTEDPMGIRRHLATFLTDQDWSHAQALRQSVNSIIQGFCARVMMLLASKLNETIMEKGLTEKANFRVINFIHDAIVFEVDAEYALKAIRLAQKLLGETMAYVTEHFGFEFAFPLDLDFEIGVKLGDLQKWDGTEDSYNQIMKKLGF